MARSWYDHDSYFRELADNLRAILRVEPSDGRSTLYVSQGYEAIWGRPAEELYEQPDSWLEGIHPEDRARVDAAWASRSGGYELEYRVVRPDGSIAHVHDRAQPIRDAGGQVVRIVGFTTDVTELRELEAQLAHAQKMESLGRLAGGVAHKVNNLLTIVLGHARRAREEPERLDEHLDRLEQTTRRGGELTSRLLSLTPSQPLRAAVVDLGALALAEEGALRARVGPACKLGITVTDGATPTRVDPVELRRLLGELVQNAAESMPGGGRIAIGVTTTDYDEEIAARHPGLEPGEHVVLSVSDNGVGIDSRERSRVFEPFFTTKHEAAGLGLATCYGIVVRAGGHIRLESVPGAGTTIVCAFPRAAAPVAAPRRSEGRPAHGEVVLVAEDEPMVRLIVAEALRAQGFRVLEAADGVEALAVAESAPPLALLVSDVVMPRMGGSELAARLRAERTDLRVLFVSGYTDGALGDEDDPATAFLPKPFMAAELVAAARALLDPEPTLSG